MWNSTTVRLILRQPAYVGRLRGWGITSAFVEELHPISGEIVEKKKQIRRADDDPEVVIFSSDVCPPLVDENTFEAVAMILRRNQEGASRNLRDPESLLLRGGFGICGYCGRYLSGLIVKKGGPYRYYCTSSKHIPCNGGRFSWLANEMDEMTWRWIMHQFENPDVLRKKFEQWKADQVEGKAIEYDRLATLKELIEKGKRRKQNCMASAADAEDEQTRLEFTQMAEESARQIRNWSDEHDQLTKVIGHAEEFRDRVESIVALGQRALEHLHQATFDDKRLTIYAFNVEVRTWRHDHNPPYEFSWGFDRLHEAWVHSRRFLGREGPLCVDSHPWQFVAVRDRTTLEHLSRTGDFAGHLAGSALGVALVAPVDAERQDWIMFDIGQAASYMQIEGWALGVGSCIATIYQPDQAQAILGIPDGWRCEVALSFGYPAEGTQPAAPRPGGRRTLDELVHWDHW
jgi:nitroreductase